LEVPIRPQTAATFVIKLVFNISAMSSQAQTTVAWKKTIKMTRRIIREKRKKKR
jgi:hypothetical protein